MTVNAIQAPSILMVSDLQVRLPAADRMVHAVRGVSFSINGGETMALVGESGCGKSLTALAVMSLLPPRAQVDVGNLSFEGEPIERTRKPTRGGVLGSRMAMIFQDPMTSLNPTMTVGRQMTEGLMYHAGVSREAARAKAIRLLDRVGISDPESRLPQFPYQLSGGQRQRVMIATALMTDPSLLIADEPTTALDVTVQLQILNLLAELRDEFRIALLLISHDLGLVARVADRISIMYAGRLVESGSTRSVFAKPMHPYTRGLLQAVPVPGRVAPGTELTTIPGTVPDLALLQPGCAFADRCSLVQPRCKEGIPPQHHLGAAQYYECIHGPADMEAIAR